MGMGPAATAKKQPEPEINVTPLVDVVLVLLIIFMVIAPALEHGERVELPAILKPDPKQKSKLDPITVTVTQSGRYYLEKESLDLEALRARLTETHAADSERRVVLKGDAGLPYSKVRELFAMVQELGFPGCALLVSKKGNAKDDDES